MSDLAIECTDIGDGVALVTLAGPLDVYAAPDLRRTLVNLTNQGRHRVALDAAGVEFVDSTGLGVLVGHLKRVKAHDGVMCLIAPSEPVARALRVTGVGKVLPAFHDGTEALEFVTQPPQPKAPDREWGHRYAYDGTGDKDESRDAAWERSRRMLPGCIEVVTREPGGEWERAEEQPHSVEEFIAQLEYARDRWRALANVRGQFVTRLRGADFDEWRAAERGLEEPRSRGWAVWRADGTLAGVEEFDVPHARAQATHALCRESDRPDGTLEPVDADTIERLRELGESGKPVTRGDFAATVGDA